MKNAFSLEECNKLIQRTEQTGYVPAKINIGGGREMLQPDVRRSLRCIIDDSTVADEIYSRVKQFIPKNMFGGNVVGLNERLRFLKYQKGL